MVARPRRDAADIRAELSLESTLVDRMSLSEPRRGLALLHLGQGHHDLADLAEREIEALEHARSEARSAGAEERLREIDRLQERLRAEVSQHRLDVIRAFYTLVTTQPNAPCIDRALFELALMHQESGEGEHARRVFRTLIQRFPRSVLAAPSWLAFGEFYFESDDMESARQFYARMLEAFDPSNELYGYTLYKLAWSSRASEGTAAVRRKLIEAIVAIRARPSGPIGSRVLSAMRHDIARLFLGERDAPPDAAALRELTREVGDDAPWVLTSVADAARVAGDWATARAVLADLLETRRDLPYACEWMASRDAVTLCDPSEPSRYGTVSCSR